MPRQDDIQKLLVLYNRRLQKLREQEALKGLNAPPEILIEIEDIEAKVAQLQAEEAGRSSPPVPPLPDDDLARELTRLTADTAGPSASTQLGGFNLSNVSGSTITIGHVSANVSAGGDIVGGDKNVTIAPATGLASPPAQLESALARWQEAVQVLIGRLDDEDDRQYLEKTAAKMIAEAKKGQAADPKKVESFLDKLSPMGPDIRGVTLTLLQAPFAGVGLVL